MVKAPIRPLTEQAETLYRALVACGPGWHSRAELAKQMGKNRLNPFDTTLLDVLRDAGRIEAEQQDTPGPITYKWVYRVKE